MYRTLVILRHTFRESIVQPIYSLLIGLGAVVLFVFAMLPFFTLGEDVVMYKAVGLDVILLLVLIATLFATSKSIYEEIEDRTMLTLMSKPVSKWEVLIGKYLGIICAAMMAIAILGAIIALCLWWRVPGDYQLNASTLDDREVNTIRAFRMMHLAGLGPSLLLIWLQISVLAAISVAVSTRVSLVVNLPVVIFIYLAGNLTQFMGGGSSPLLIFLGASIVAATIVTLVARVPIVVKVPIIVVIFLVGVLTQFLGGGWFASAINTLVPYLANFDLRQKTVYARIALGGATGDVNAVHLSEIWSYTAFAAAYALCYASFALAAGMLLFQGRELGGGEG